jgi:hypothetical protein
MIAARTICLKHLVELIVPCSGKQESIFNRQLYHVIWIEESEKKAIKKAYDLSEALKVKDASGKAITVLEKKIKSEENKYDFQKEWLSRNRNSHFLFCDKMIVINQSSCAATKISMIFLPAEATEVPGPKMATTPASYRN